MTARILTGDAREVLRTLPDESVHCAISSPPYWGLRAYGGDSGMIGLEPTFDEHLANLVAVFREVRRVLRSDGTLWLNYGDAYSSHSGGKGFGGMQDANRGTEAKEYTRNWGGMGYKQLLMMPARVAMALQADGVADAKALAAIDRAAGALVDAYDGEPPDRAMAALEALAAEYRDAKGDSWWLRSEIVWHKPNPMPESCRDRPTSSHEKLFLLSRSAKYFYDAEAVRQPCASGPSDIKKMIESRERIGGKHKALDDPFSKASAATNIGQKRSVGDPAGANLRNVWTIATHSFKEAHFATFPPALVEPCIKAGTSEFGVCGKCATPWGRVTEREFEPQQDVSAGKGVRGHAGQKATAEENGWAGSPRGKTHSRTTGWAPICGCTPETACPATVLDPFGGSGTVGLVAERLDRASILIEISAEYAEMARRRIEDDAPLFTQIA